MKGVFARIKAQYAHFAFPTRRQSAYPVGCAYNQGYTRDPRDSFRIIAMFCQKKALLTEVSYKKARKDFYKTL